MTLGEKVRQARKGRSLTQRALAGSDLSESFISMLEHDKVRPSLETLRIIASRLSLPLGELLDADLPVRSQVTARLEVATVLLSQHQFTDALEAFQEAERMAVSEASLEVAFRIQNGLGQALTGLRQFDLAVQHIERAHLLAGALGRPDLVARVANATGILSLRQRDFPAARDTFARALTAVRQQEPIDALLEGKILMNLGRAYLELGLPAQALECHQAALERVEPLKDLDTLGHLHFNLGIAHEKQQAFEQARMHLAKAAILFEAKENLQLLGTVKRSIGILLIDRGQAEEGTEALKQSLALASRVADDAGRAQTLTELARASVLQGDLEVARAQAEEAIRLAVKMQDPAEAALAESVMAAICHKEGRLEEAANRYEYALSAFERLEMAGEVARVSRDFAFILMERGEERQAARFFAKAFRAQEAAVSTR